jgi:hypothetical protein
MVERNAQCPGPLDQIYLESSKDTSEERNKPGFLSASRLGRVDERSSWANMRR